MRHSIRQLHLPKMQRAVLLPLLLQEQGKKKKDFFPVDFHELPDHDPFSPLPETLTVLRGILSGACLGRTAAEAIGVGITTDEIGGCNAPPLHPLPPSPPPPVPSSGREKAKVMEMLQKVDAEDPSLQTESLEERLAGLDLGVS